MRRPSGAALDADEWTCEDMRLRGCIRRMTLPRGGGVARERLCLSLLDAIRFYDPFQGRG